MRAKGTEFIYRVIVLFLHDCRRLLELQEAREHDRIEVRLIIAVADMICDIIDVRQERLKSGYATPELGCRPLQESSCMNTSMSEYRELEAVETIL